MIVELNWGQRQALAPAIEVMKLGDLIQEYVAPVGSHPHWLALPAIAWTQVSAGLERTAFNAGGYRRKHVSASLHSLIRRINQQLARVIGHPAMRGEFEPGPSNEVFVAWPTGNAEIAFTPFPIPGREAVVLVPSYAKRTLDMGGGPAEWDVTIWEWMAAEVMWRGDVPFGLFIDPGDHYRFVTPSGATGQRSTAP